MKKIVAVLTMLIILIIGGCSMFNKKETLTKEQQDNVVRRISLNYKIEKIEFIDFIRDEKTGFYRLFFVINDEYSTGISVNDISRFDNSTDEMGLDPIDVFEKFMSKNNDFKKVKIKYLGK